MMDQDVFTVDEAAEFLRVSRPTIYRWMREGLLHYYMLPGASRRIKREDLERLLKPGSPEDESDETDS